VGRVLGEFEGNVVEPGGRIRLRRPVLRRLALRRGGHVRFGRVRGIRIGRVLTGLVLDHVVFVVDGSAEVVDALTGRALRHERFRGLLVRTLVLARHYRASLYCSASVGRTLSKVFSPSIAATPAAAVFASSARKLITLSSPSATVTALMPRRDSSALRAASASSVSIRYRGPPRSFSTLPEAVTLPWLRMMTSSANVCAASQSLVARTTGTPEDACARSRDMTSLSDSASSPAKASSMTTTSGSAARVAAMSTRAISAPERFFSGA